MKNRFTQSLTALTLGLLIAVCVSALIALKKWNQQLDQAAEPFSFRNAVSIAAPAVVTVHVKAEESKSSGSGVLLREEGLVITNFHVISQQGVSSIAVEFAHGMKSRAYVVGIDPATDLAVLRTSQTPSRTPLLTPAPPESIQVGDVVLAIGSPLGLSNSVTTGIISGLGRRKFELATHVDFIQTDAAINQGNSGGALVDTKGQLVGIITGFSTTGSSQQYTGIGWSIPVSRVLDIVDEILANGRVTRGWLGVETTQLTPELAQRLKTKISQGLIVTQVKRAAPAWHAGVRPGDIIISLDGIPTYDGTTAMRRVALKRPGDQVAIEVARQGHFINLIATASERPLEIDANKNQPSTLAAPE